MSMAHLGPSFDIHTGGVDLIFPHHEDEIAQSEAATGQPFVGTWLHCAHLQMGGSKMAKSTGNIARVGDLLAAGRLAAGAPLALISVHYRAALNHSDDVAGGGGRRARAARRGASPRSTRTARTARTTPTLAEALAEARGRASGRRSTTTSTCRPPSAALFDLVRDLNRRIERADAVDRRRRPGRWRCSATSTASWRSCPTRADDLEPAAAALLDERAAARAARDWAARTGCATSSPSWASTVEDTRDGQRWRRTVEAGRG